MELQESKISPAIKSKTFILIAYVLVIGILAVLVVIALNLNQNNGIENKTSEITVNSISNDQDSDNHSIVNLSDEWSYYSFERCVVDIPTPPSDSEVSENGVSRSWGVVDSFEIIGGGFDDSEFSVGFYTYDSSGQILGGERLTNDNFVIDCIDNPENLSLEEAFQAFLERVNNEGVIFVERTGDTEIFGVEAIRIDVGVYSSTTAEYEQLFFILNNRIYRVGINIESYEEIINEIVEGVEFR